MLQQVGKLLPLQQNVLDLMKLFVIQGIYGDFQSATAGTARAKKWKALKKKTTLRLCPDDDSLIFLCQRAIYLAYIQLHPEIKDHPSPLGNGWTLKDGSCYPVRYTCSAFPTELTVPEANIDVTDESDISSSDSESDLSESEGSEIDF